MNQLYFKKNWRLWRCKEYIHIFVLLIYLCIFSRLIVLVLVNIIRTVIQLIYHEDIGVSNMRQKNIDKMIIIRNNNKKWKMLNLNRWVINWTDDLRIKNFFTIRWWLHNRNPKNTSHIFVEDGLSWWILHVTVHVE